MKWFLNLSTRGKLLLGFGFMWLLLAGTTVAAYLAITGISDSARDLYDVHYTVALELRELRSHQNYIRGKMLELLMTEDRAERDAIRKDIEGRDGQIDALLASVVKLDLDPDFQQKISDLESVMAAYRQGCGQEISLIESGKGAAARLLGRGEQDARFEKIRAIAVELGDKAQADMGKQIVENELAARRTTRLFILAGVLSFSLGALMVFSINRAIAKPMGDLNKTAQLIASGAPGPASAAVTRKDEVGVLAQTFSRMAITIRSISEMVEKIASGDLRVSIEPQSENDLLSNSLAKMVGNLRTSTAALSESISYLGSSASEILAATTQVSSGTAEIASAISQTTATVEEVRQAARLSSEKAKNVSDNAQRVSEISQSGQKAVEDTVEGMIRIRDQMESIAQTIVRLSEQGQSIGGIIASVTDFADQSNLLAVNAAIEAARAGEQGKGFVVVAQEIKSLAEQSKQATAQIRGILSELQKATGAAVMATEQGSKAVEAGVKQSAQAGEAIRALTDSTSEAAQTAIQIVASSQQQVIGMDQIGIAMENINQAGTQTAASMRQAEIAAQNLHELGRKLKVLVDQYQT